MNTQEFFELVKKMRAAQKLYFRSRLQGDLMTAKRLEGEVDAVIGRGLTSTTVSAEEERQLRLHLEDERDAGEMGEGR
jgi:hypothetical protein